MTNVFIRGLEDVGKVIEWPVTHAAKLISIFTTAMKDYPAVRSAAVGLVQQIEVNVTDLAKLTAEKGLNFADDEAELAAAKALWAYAVSVFLPAIKQAIEDEEKASGVATTTTQPAA